MTGNDSGKDNRNLEGIIPHQQLVKVSDISLYIKDNFTQVDFYNEEGAILRNKGKTVIDKLFARHVFVKKSDSLERRQEESPHVPEGKLKEGKANELYLDLLKKDPKKAFTEAGISLEAAEAHYELGKVVEDILSKGLDKAKYRQAENMMKQVMKSDLSGGVFLCLNLFRYVDDNVTLHHSVSTGVILSYVLNDIQERIWGSGSHTKDAEILFEEFKTYPEVIFTEDHKIKYITGGILHDIGKICIPQEIIKKPGSLTPEELKVIKRHPLEGYKQILKIGIDDPHIQDIVKNHHPDYPLDAVPGTMARLFTPIDKFDSLIERRYYKEPFSIEKTVQILEASRREHNWNQMVFAITLNRLIELNKARETHERRVLRYQNS